VKIKVLIADDHAVLREGLAALLSAQPDITVVGGAANGREALNLARELAPDLVVMDVAMPELNGIEAARELARRDPPIPVVMLSMHSGIEHVTRALQAGAAGYLLKDSAGREIIEAVRAVHAGRRYLSPPVAEIVAQHVRSGSPGSPLDLLSPRERQILQLVAEGRTSAAIAATLHLSPKTVETYRSRMMDKLEVADVTGLVKFAIRHGLASPE
jgi:DNA-binding NarL/FixJ family response regulator